MTDPAADVVMNPAATGHLPFFITLPGQPDVLMKVMLVFLLVAIVSVGLLYLKLHALPEHIAPRTNKIQLQLVGALALLALFTHNNFFWVAALLIALVELPDYMSPMNSMARSLRRMAGRESAADREEDALPGDPAPLSPVLPVPETGAAAGVETASPGPKEA